MEDGFGPRDVVKLTGLGSYDTLDYWATTGFLKPSIRDARGQQVTRLYAFSDVIAVRVAVELRAQGVSLQAMRRIVARLAKLKDTPAHPLAAARLLVSGKDVLVAYDQQTLVSLLAAPNQGAFRMIVELEPVVREVREAVSKLRRAA